MATQVKHRRGTNAEILAGTPAIGELWFNTTDNSIHMGDGVTQGGIKQSLRVDVRNFGAKGDGVTDDWLAIHKALRYVAEKGGGEIYYPPGVYIVSRAIRLDNFDYVSDSYLPGVLSRIVHRGAGSEATTLKSIEYSSIFSAFPEPYLSSGVVPTTTSGSDILITGMTLDCNYTDVPDYSTTTYSNVDKKYEVSKLGGTWKNGASTPTVATWAADNYQYPIYLIRNERVTVRDCLIKRSWYNGVEIYNSNDIRVLDNVFLNVGDKPNSFGTYCAVQPDNSTTKVWIMGNTIESCGSGIVSNGDPLAYANSPVSHITVANNQFINLTGAGIYAFAWVQDWVVYGNVFEGIGSTPIYVFEDNRAGKVANRHPDRWSITGNIINSYNINNGDAVGIRFEGITANIAENIIIQRRTQTTANTRAILVADANIDLGTYERYQVNVSNNVCQGRFPTDSNSGVIQVSLDGTTLSNNSVISVDTVAETPFVLYRDNCVLSDNNVSGDFNYKYPYKFVGVSGSIQDSERRPLFEAKVDTTQVSLAAKYYTVAWDNWGTIILDNLNMYEAPNDQISTPYKGYYRVTFTARFQNVGSVGTPNIILAGIEVGGTIVDSVSEYVEGTNTTIQVSSLIPLEALNTVQARIYSDDADWNFLSGSRMTFEYVGNFV